MSINKKYPYCNGNDFECDYCDGSGILNLSEIYRFKDNDKLKFSNYEKNYRIYELNDE